MIKLSLIFIQNRNHFTKIIMGIRMLDLSKRSLTSSYGAMNLWIRVKKIRVCYIFVFNNTFEGDRFRRVAICLLRESLLTARDI